MTLPVSPPLRPALFLDRDGVIHAEVGFVHEHERIVFTDGIFALCRAAHAKGFLLIVITNQSGIGRGLFSEEAFHALMEWMKERFAREGAPLTEVYYCPHHPEHGLGQYKRDCADRKPNPGMILRAKADFGIDLQRSCFIGDQERDMQAAEKAGVGRRLLFSLAPSARHMTIRSLHEAMPLLDAV